MNNSVSTDNSTIYIINNIRNILCKASARELIDTLGKMEYVDANTIFDVLANNEDITKHQAYDIWMATGNENQDENWIKARQLVLGCITYY